MPTPLPSTPICRALATILLSVGILACGDPGLADPDSLRFAQRGSVQIALISPLALGEGTLEQTLEWRSEGPWTLTEKVTYGIRIGDVNQRKSSVMPEVAAGQYAQWITQVNDNPGLSLFVSGLSSDLKPECLFPASTLTLTLNDESTRTSRSWIRCVQGFLSTLTPVGSGPDPGAPRVANVATLARDFTLGQDFISAFGGTLPFGTLAHGDVLQTGPDQPEVISSAAGLSQWWSRLNLPSQSLPSVDFEQETVILAAVGQRLEAGDSVDVRRILPVAEGTIVELVLQVPGDFCSPAERRHFPYHVVVVPKLRAPIRFSQPVSIERIPCG